MKTLFLSLSLCFALDAVQSALAAVRVGAGRGAPCATVPVPVAFTAPTGAVIVTFGNTASLVGPTVTTPFEEMPAPSAPPVAVETRTPVTVRAFVGGALVAM